MDKDGMVMSDEGKLDRRKKRLQGLLKTAHYALGGMAEDAMDQAMDMDMGKEDFLSDDTSAPHMGMPEDPEHEVDGMGKAKARLAKLMRPKFKKK